MSTLTKGFIFSIVALIVFMFATAPDVKRINRTQVDFHVNASDRLYFKNLRQYYYVMDRTTEDQFEVFTLKEELNENSSPFRFKIINNWRIDEAYIMLNDTADEKQWMELEIKDSERQERYNLRGLNAFDQVQLAIDVFEALQTDDTRFELHAEDRTAIGMWDAERDRKHAIRVLKDYFKLIGAIR